MRLVALGEAMVELCETEAPGLMQMGFAGDTLNTAWYLKRLRPDWNVEYVTNVGHDTMSYRLVTFLMDAGLGTSHIGRHPTRGVGLYMIATEGGERHFSYWRSRSAARTFADDRARLDAAFAKADMVYLSGITLAILDVVARAHLMEALRNARASGSTIAFDPNLRPELWPDPDVMRGAVMQMAELADIALPSHEDEANWFGDTDARATALRYAAVGATTVIVKDGARDVVSHHTGTTTLYPVTASTKVVDTTAAGDSFNAGVLSAIGGGASVGEAVRAGASLARRVIAGRGALVAEAVPKTVSA
ncbi:MAG: sugar kinase [Pseudomonadota bacterium]